MTATQVLLILVRAMRGFLPRRAGSVTGGVRAGASGSVSAVSCGFSGAATAEDCGSAASWCGSVERAARGRGGGERGEHAPTGST
ncbi:hypothetical protein ABIA39_007485 [Nocardia sp. GAS34]|uniref:hypothetical protein n=1 Tax=unclassified Nocardia TaxID=2637762 RepID=UPI003D231E4B